jgi:two-component system CheB/CheR fusion protein
MSDSDDGEAQAEPVPATDPGFRPLLDKLSTTYNFDFREYKEPLLARRIRARMAALRIEGFDAYARYLDQHADEHIALFNTILINVTTFFRDPDAWKLIGSDVIPRIVDAARESRSIRIWCAGCSSGEEPYSITMLLAEHLGDRAGEYLVKIYGTDVDEDALSTARHAVYRLEQLKEVPSELVDRYFARDGQLYRFRRELRRWCIFGSHNLTQAPPLSHIDLLVCRNVLIYFTSELQERILARFHYAIREHGYLFLGRSESLLARSRMFRPVQLKWRIFERASSVGRQVSAVLPDRDERHGTSAEHLPRTEASDPLRSPRALDVLPAAVVIIDTTDTVVAWNPAADALFDIPPASAQGRKFRDLDVSYRVEALRSRIEDVKSRHAPARLENVTLGRRNGDTVYADVSILPIVEAYRLVGVLVFAIETTEHARLKDQMSGIAEQHATAIEELQSTNEELETTNEELQSSNEELETTNEELQSTNEELETTVEELQAANTELGALNAELETRTAELNRLDSSHQALLNSLEDGLAVLDREGLVTVWNHAAFRMWGLRPEQALNRQFFALPLGDAAGPVRATFERALVAAVAAEVSDVPFTLPGGTRPGTLRMLPVRGPSGEVTGVVAVMTPIGAKGGS